VWCLLSLHGQSANDGTYSSGAYGSVGLEKPEPGNMIPYADLTEEIVVGWVKDHFGAEKVGEIEAALPAATRSTTCTHHRTGSAVGWLIAASTLLAIAIVGMMAWQWCHTSDWQDRYWWHGSTQQNRHRKPCRPQSKPKLTAGRQTQ
jgi:hypothetical protein